ncbi:hypothetical protein [Nostoc phage Nsp-JY10]
MPTVIEWPIELLTPGSVRASVVPFTRGGGTTLGGITPSVRTDLGYWAIDYMTILLRNRDKAQWSVWNAIRQKLGGRSGPILVPVRSALSAPYESGRYEEPALLPHSDGSSFSDGSLYLQGSISVQAVGTVSVGSTAMRMRMIKGAPNLAGVRFSYGNALYETGPASDIDGDIWSVPIWPAARSIIPDGAYLEFDRPACVCRLADDRGMDIDQNTLSKHAITSVSFIEDVEYWSA